MNIVRVLANRLGTERVEIFERPNGTFGFRHSVWDDRGHSWVARGRYSEVVVDSAARAADEARARVGGIGEAGTEVVAAAGVSTAPSPRTVPGQSVAPSVIALTYTIARRLLDGPEEGHTLLRHQLEHASVTSVTFTGAGLFVDFTVASGIPRAGSVDLTGGEVELCVAELDAPAGALLRVTRGTLAFVEIYTYGHRPWPDVSRDVTFNASSAIGWPHAAT